MTNNNDLGMNDGGIGSSGNGMISEQWAVGGNAAQPVSPAGVGAGGSASVPSLEGWLVGTNAASPSPLEASYGPGASRPVGKGPNAAPGISHVDVGVSPLADLQNFLIGDDHA